MLEMCIGRVCSCVWSCRAGTFVDTFEVEHVSERATCLRKLLGSLCEHLAQLTHFMLTHVLRNVVRELHRVLHVHGRFDGTRVHVSRVHVDGCRGEVELRVVLEESNQQRF